MLARSVEPFIPRSGRVGPGVAILVAAALSVPHVALGDCGLLISEYVEGSAGSRAVEIQNPTDAAVDLEAGGYQILIYLNGCTTPAMTIDLTGTIPPHDVFVLAHPRAAASLVPFADQLDASLWFTGDDALALVKSGGVVLDVVGQIGFDPGAEWGSGLASTSDNTLRRKVGILEGDPIGNDPFDPAVGWDGYATDTFTNLGAPNGSANCGVTGVTDARGDLAARLLPPRPNPAGEESWLGLSLGTPGKVRLEVADVAGRLVRVLVNQELDGGSHAIHWDGRDHSGQRVRSGVYFIRLVMAGMRQERMLIHLVP